MGNKENNTLIVRPWVRLGAKYIDLLLFSLIFDEMIFFFLGVNSFGAFHAILGLLTWTLIEPFILTTCGTTLGKWLLRIEIRNIDGSKISYMKALVRSFGIWVNGFGMGIPILSLMTLIFSYARLYKKGITSWDQNGNFIILHQKIGILRIMFVIILCPIFLSLAILVRNVSYNYYYQ